MEETLRSQCFSWFCENRSASLRNAADHFNLSYETVRDWAKADQWHTKRTLSQYADIDDDVGAQAQLLRALVVERATEESTSTGELCKLIEAFEALAKFKPSEEGIPRDLLDSLE